MRQRVVQRPALVLRAIRRRRPGVVAIDGVPGAGKSTLARYLGARLGIRPTHIDHYLRARGGSFLRCIRYGVLRRQLLRGSKQIIEGVCVLQVLDTLRTKPSILVYVKRLSLGRWVDQSDVQVSPQDLQEGAWSGLDIEVAQYHSVHRPHITASICYARDDA